MTKLVAVGTLVLAALVSGCATGIVNKPPSDVTETSATVNGIVWTTDGGQVSYWVEYGTTDAYDKLTTHQTTSVAEDKPHDVSVPLEGLSPATTVHYRLCAEDAQAGTCSKDATLSTGDSVVGEARQCAGGQEPPCEDFGGLGPIQDILTVDARSTASGDIPSGTIEVGFSRASRGASGYSGQVTCLHVADEVAIVGALGQHFGPFEADNFPAAFVVRVTDGGGPGSRRDTWELLDSEGGFEEPPPPALTNCASFANQPPSQSAGVNQEGDVHVTDVEPQPTSQGD